MNWYKRAKNAVFVNQVADVIEDLLGGKYQERWGDKAGDVFSALDDLVQMDYYGFSRDPASRKRLIALLKARGQRPDKELLQQLYGLIRGSDKVNEAFLSNPPL